MNKGFRAGFVAVIVGVAVIAPFSYAAKEVIGLVRSGAIDGGAVPVPAASEMGPFAFSETETPERVDMASIDPSAVPLAIATAMAPPAVTQIIQTPANPIVDRVTTASVPATPVRTVEIKGSAEFEQALATLNEGKLQDALDLAADLDSAVERHTIEWASIQFNPGAAPYRSIKRFMTEAPQFANAELFQTRLEESLAREQLPADKMLETLGGEPTTVEGQIALARALLSDGKEDHAGELARQIWTENFLTRTQEKRVLDSFGALLDRDAHWQRAMHLMMNDRAKGSARLLPFLTSAQKTLVEARAAVSRNDKDAKAKLDDVDPAMQTNPVYIFSRAQRALQFELWESAAEWFSKAPDEVPDAAEWWYERRTLIRKLVNNKQYQLAFEVADGYRSGPEARLMDARFHAGWIALAFLDDAGAAKQHFTEMTKHTTLPDSIAQANYWLGRADTKLGDTAAAKAAFQAAARYSTVYYGQLALGELGQQGIDIRPLPDARDTATLFQANPVVQAIRLLHGSGKKSMAMALLRQYSEGLEHGGEFMLAAQLAQEIDAPQLSISIAGLADTRGTPLDELNFPHDALPQEARLGTDRAAVFAIARQESMFQIDAVSSVGARGLMQLMPGTAKEVASEVGVDYSPARLVNDPEYNALLGSTYLGKQLKRYDGSLVLAAAAYNAGPGNANKWIKAYGDPRDGKVDPVVWVELIPFQETRTYVKRVLGNYLVYSERLGNEQVTLKQALRTIDE
ncbi:MAG TPA: lytic transglycosylase domain-containing protein [Devosia sp.]